MKVTPRTLSILGLLILGGVLAFAFGEILDRRLSEGGIYPAYASFRSDPLGTSALFETFDRMERIQVSRNLGHLNSVKGIDEDTALFLLGYPRDGIEDLRAPKDSPVMAAVEGGARLIVTLNPGLVPEIFRPATTDEEDDWMERRRKFRDERIKRRGGKPKKDDSDTDAQEDEEEEEFEERMADSLGPRLTAKLGFDVAEVEGFERPEEGWKTQPGDSITAEDVPAALPDWHSQFHFEIEDRKWKIAVLVEDKPVVIERKFGKGSIVFASDTFFVSNEALHAGADPEFLLWLVGDKAKVVFDETIHGSQETGGAMKLIRRYRLHGVFLGLLFFVALWAWRSASTLAPGSDDLDRGLVGGGTAVAGEDTGAGLIRLLQRSVPDEALLEQCIDSWEKSQHTEVTEVKRKEIARISNRHSANPKDFSAGDAYSAITKLLRKR